MTFRPPLSIMPNQYNWGKNRTSMDIEQIGGTCFVTVSNIEAPEKRIESKLLSRTSVFERYSKKPKYNSLL